MTGASVIVYDPNGVSPDMSKMEDENTTLKRIGPAGKCRHCGKWQSNVWNHETNICEKRFRRKR